VEGAGNPVPALVDAMRAQITDADVAACLHKGLTSQDVLDTALVLVARDALSAVSSSLDLVADALASLADDHRDTVMAGRTLTQHAVPVTFGLKAAQWLVGVVDAQARVRRVRSTLPVQCGGAAGTMALASELVADPLDLAAGLATRLSLTWPGLPWHTRRTPITTLGDALVQVCEALGVIANDVLLLGRPEIGEVSEGVVRGRGGSSTMPQKQNPVLAVLVRAAALQAPQLLATLHIAAAQYIDERPDGAWHSEWPALQRLLSLAVVASAHAADLVPNLVVRPDVMRRRAEEAQGILLAERPDGQQVEVDGYLGATSAFVDTALLRYRTRSAPDA